MKTKFNGILTLLLAFTVHFAFAQKTVSGTVTDDTGPLPGVSVIIEGTTTGTETDFEGQYSIVTKNGDVLHFSYVGYEDVKKTVGASNLIDVTMSGINVLDEVVVTALGISREKKTLGYAVEEVGGEEINKVQQTNAVSALSGRVSGVQVNNSGNMGGSNRILIRGANSITQENQPLFIVDGVPVDNSTFNVTGTASGGGGVDYGNLMNDINADEIEDINVLKGPAAALYGSRAANGVIIITTKRAKQSNKGFSVDFKSGIDFQTVSTIPILQDKYGGGATISDADGGVSGFEQITYNGTNYLVPQYAVDESWGPRFNEDTQVVHWDGIKEDGSVETRPWVAPENGVTDYWNTGISVNNSIGISKSEEKYGIRFAYKNTDIGGTMPNSSLKRNDFKLASNIDLTSKLHVNSIINYVNSDAIGRPEIGYGDNSVGQKFFQWGQRQLDYNRLRAYKTSTGEMRTWNRNSFFDSHAKYADNPFWTAYENFNDDTRNRIYGSLSASYDLLENLTLKGSIYGDYYNFSLRERTAVGSQATSYYYEGNRENRDFNYESILSYNTDISDFGVKAMVGANTREVRLDFLRGQSSGGLVVPNVYSLRNSADSPLVNDRTTSKKVNSVFGQLSLDYKGIINLDGTYRTDWSSSLPDDNNEYSYPSLSASFVFSELFEASWLNLGKIRAGYAEVGNDTDPYNVYSTYAYNEDGPFQSSPRLFLDDELLNENLLPETTKSKEVGLDLVMFNNRVDISASYFDNQTYDQIMPLQVSEATGFDTKWINAGQMSNKGIELAVNLVPLRSEKFEWRIGANYTKIDNKLEELFGDLESLDIQRAPFGGVFLRASLGDTYGMLWGTDFLYDDDGNKVIGSNGYYESTADLVPLGSVLPDYTLGITNSISYGNFDLGFLVDIRKGGNFYSLSHMWGMYSGMLEETAGVNDLGNEIRDPVSEGGGIRLDGVTGTVVWDEDGNYTVTDTAPNETYVSGAGWAARHYHGFGFPSAQSVFKADYVKLREVNLGYKLPTKLLNWSNGYINGAKISVFGRNLMTFGLDKDGFDPEMTANGSGNVQGLDGGLQPLFRTYGFNMIINF